MKNTQDALATIRESLDLLRSRIAETRGELNDLYTELNAASQAPPDPSDVERELSKAIDTLCDDHGRSLAALIQPYLADRANVDYVHRNLINLVNNHTLKDTGLLALLRPALKAGISGELSRMDWPSGCLTDAERQRRIDALEPTRVQLHEKLAALEDDAKSLGLVA